MQLLLKLLASLPQLLHMDSWSRPRNHCAYAKLSRLCLLLPPNLVLLRSELGLSAFRLRLHPLCLHPITTSASALCRSLAAAFPTHAQQADRAAAAKEQCPAVECRATILSSIRARRSALEYFERHRI